MLQVRKGEKNGEKSYIGPTDKIPEHLRGRIANMMVAANIRNQLEKPPDDPGNCKSLLSQ